MQKRLSLSLCLLFLGIASILAVPARRIKKIVTLLDGTQVEAVLRGDETCHFYETADGTVLREQEDGSFVECDRESVFESWSSKVAKRNASRRTKSVKYNAEGANKVNAFVGEKRGLVVLVNFADKSLLASHGHSFYNDFFNLKGYSQNGAIGSVSDYFNDCSYGKFSLVFDVVGPVTLSKSYSYYGKNDSHGDDMHVGEMAAEVCKLADKAGVDFSKYDWDGDGYVDQVFIIYAGYGESQGAPANTVWPHEWDLTSAATNGDGDGSFILDGVHIDTYACSCELNGTSGTTADGIGTACHEFSHCLGLPDMYDTSKGGTAFGMDRWDLMDYGSYVGPQKMGECPTGYTSYERMFCGWLTPTELSSPCFVEGLKSLDKTPEAYIIYNDANRNEYYLLENRQKEGWFKYAEGHGMLVLHVDYDKSVWDANEVNATYSHQRMTIIPAGGALNNSTSVAAAVPYPGTKNNTSLTDISSPAATLYNSNIDGRKLMGKPITDIKENSGQISFAFMGGVDLKTPVALAASNVGADGFRAKWNAVENAQEYELVVMGKDDGAVDIADMRVLDEDFSGFKTGVSDGSADIASSINSYMHTAGWTGSKVYTSSSDRAKLGSSKANGWLASPAVSSTTGQLTVYVAATSYSTDTGKIVISCGGTEVGSFTPAATVTPYVVSFNVNSATSIKFATSSKRAYINAISVYDGKFTAEEIESQTATGSLKYNETFTTTNTYYDVTDLDASLAYSYKVRAKAKSVVTDWSNTVDVELTTDGVADVGAESVREDEAWYDLQGRRVVQPRRGLYIQKGKIWIKR